MRKHILMAIIASIAIMSCTKDDVTEVNKGREIDFRTALTKAPETDLSNLNNIYVTGFIGQNDNNYFTDIEYSKNNDNTFSSDVKYYWPFDGSVINFFAYAPSATDLGVGDDSETEITIDKDVQTITAYSPSEDVSYQQDIIVAKATGSREDESTGVELIFDHVLSQIEFLAYSNNPGYVFKIKGVKLVNVVGTGDLDLSDKSWSTSNYSKVSYEITYDTPKELSETPVSVMSTEDDNAMLIPQTLTKWNGKYLDENDNGAYVSLLVNITTKSGALVYPKTEDEYAWMATPFEAVWSPGFKYIYKLDVSDGGMIDPEDVPDTPVNPEDPENPENPTPSTPGNGGNILGGAIKINGTVQSWGSYSQTQTI